MSETGATKAQIEAAVTHWYASFGGKVSRVQTESEGAWRDDLLHYASHLVPPGARIVDADVLRRLHALCVAAQKFIDIVGPWDFRDDTVNVVVSRDAVCALWDAEASTSDSHDDRRLAALVEGS